MKQVFKCLFVIVPYFSLPILNLKDMSNRMALTKITDNNENKVIESFPS